MNAEVLMMIASIVGFLTTLYWVRSRELRERYAIGWILTAAVLLICGVFPQLLMQPAKAWSLSYPAMVLFVALTCIYVFLFFVSVALTSQHRRNVRLTQELAHCRYRICELDAAVQALSEHKPPAAVEEALPLRPPT